MTFLLHMLRVGNHVAKAAEINWFPWTNHPERSAIGWEGEPHGGGPHVFYYLIPDTEAPVPALRVYIGPHGDPDLDELVATL
jgi:hypothetical protein